MPGPLEFKMKVESRWALSTDFVILLIFVLISALWYKAFINGKFYGVALHMVSESYLESYGYESFANSSLDESLSSETRYKINESEEEIILYNELSNRDQIYSM